MSNEEHYFENLLYRGEDSGQNQDDNRKWLSKEVQEAIETCYYYVCYSIFNGERDLSDFINWHTYEDVEEYPWEGYEDKRYGG